MYLGFVAKTFVNRRQMAKDAGCPSCGTEYEAALKSDDNYREPDGLLRLF